MKADKTAEQAQATRDAIKQAGGLEAVSAATGISTTQLSRYQSEREKDSMPLHVIELVESFAGAGCAEITRHLAASAGYVLVPVPNGGQQLSQSVAELLIEDMEINHETQRRILSALTFRGGISRVEAKALVKQFRQQLEIVAALIAKMEAIAGDGQ